MALQVCYMVVGQTVYSYMAYRSKYHIKTERNKHYETDSLPIAGSSHVGGSLPSTLAADSNRNPGR